MRLRRERQQATEDLEREVATLREERSQMNQKLSELLNKLTSLSLSEAGVDVDSDR
jgi:prefoldin subunit 5